MKKTIQTSFFLLIAAFASAQSITLTPNSSGTNTEGKMYYDNATHSFLYWNGTAFTSLGGGGVWSRLGGIRYKY